MDFEEEASQGRKWDCAFPADLSAGLTGALASSPLPLRARQLPLCELPGAWPSVGAWPPSLSGRVGPRPRRPLPGLPWAGPRPVGWLLSLMSVRRVGKGSSCGDAAIWLACLRTKPEIRFYWVSTPSGWKYSILLTCILASDKVVFSDNSSRVFRSG